MGAKYLPTTKDLKANQRFQQKQELLRRQKKLAGEQPPRPGKKQ